MKFLKFILVLAFIVGSSMFLFYWFQIRPSDIRENCYEELKEKAKTMDLGSKNSANNMYRICLVRSGLQAEDLVK